jgi:hypothetical protein
MHWLAGTALMACLPTALSQALAAIPDANSVYLGVCECRSQQTIDGKLTPSPQGRT